MFDLFMYETTPDGGLDGGGAAEPAAPVEAPVEAVAEADPGDAQPEHLTAEQARELAAEEFDALWNARQQQQGQYDPPIAGATPGPLSDRFPGEYDPFDPESVAAHDQWLLDQMTQRFDAKIAPVTQTFQEAQAAQAQEQAEAYVQDVLEAEVGRGEDLTEEGKGMLRSAFDVYMAENAARYGYTARSVEKSAQDAANYIRSIEKAAADRAIAQYTNHINTLEGAPASPAAAAGAVVVPGQPAKYLTTDELVARHAASIKAAA